MLQYQARRGKVETPVKLLGEKSELSTTERGCTCAFPCTAVRLDCFALHVAFPRSPVGHHSYDYYQSSVAIFLAEGRRSRVSSRWHVLARRRAPPHLLT
jgi:hypothetical protein